MSYNLANSKLEQSREEIIKLYQEDFLDASKIARLLNSNNGSMGDKIKKSKVRFHLVL